MASHGHPDPVARLRLALWGETDAATRAVAAHARTCSACDADVRDVAALRDLVRRVEGAGPSASARAAVARRMGGRAARPESAWTDLSWLPAVPVGSLAGVRSTDAPDRLMRCEDGDLRLDVAARADDAPGRWTITGQVLLDGCVPGADLVVSLFLDGRRTDAVRTDRYGEFSLRARGARRLGVSVAGRGRTRRIELWRDGPPSSDEDAL